MWDRPQLLNTLADLLFAAAAAMLLVAVAIWVLRMPIAPIREVRVETPLVHVNPGELEEMLQERVKGNFFSVPLEQVRKSLERLPWVRSAQVRRVWPGRVEVTLVEHRPVARWGDSREEWVNSYGEVFVASLSEEEAPELPVLEGPIDSSAFLLRRYGEISEILKPLALQPMVLALSGRHAIGVKLDNGMWLELGREQTPGLIEQRLQRFVTAYPTLIAGRTPPPVTVDLRYPNGFALSAVGRYRENRGRE